jgi:hypothetical protein
MPCLPAAACRPTLLGDEKRTIEDAKLVPDQLVMLEIQDIASGHWPCEQACSGIGSVSHVAADVVGVYSSFLRRRKLGCTMQFECKVFE